jgi:hypothetical protein
LESKTLKNGHFILAKAASVIICVAGLASQAQASVFQADGLFADGSTLGGTLTIDTNVGAVTASDLTISGAGTFSTIVFQQNFGSPLGYSVIADNDIGTEEFSFGLVTDSLVGYAGGDLCSESSVGCFSSNYYPISSSFDQVALSNGRLIGESSAVPEPGALSFWSTPFALGLLFYRRARSRDYSGVKAWTDSKPNRHRSRDDGGKFPGTNHAEMFS